MLRLNFLHDQTIEHLLLEHALRGQFDFLFLQPLGDRVHLGVQLAFQHQAVVHDGGDAVEHFTVHADIPGLCMGHGRQEHCRGNTRARQSNFEHHSNSSFLRGLILGIRVSR